MDIGLFIIFTAYNKDYRRCSLILHSKFNTIYVLCISMYQVLLSPWWCCNNKPEDQYPWLIYEFYECHLQHMTRLIKLTSRVHGTSCRYSSLYSWIVAYGMRKDYAGNVVECRLRHHRKEKGWRGLGLSISTVLTIWIALLTPDVLSCYFEVCSDIYKLYIIRTRWGTMMLFSKYSVFHWLYQQKIAIWYSS